FREAAQLQRRISAKAVTVLRNDRGTLPLQNWETAPQRIVLLRDQASPRMIAANESARNQVLRDELTALLPNVAVSLDEIGADGYGADAALAASQTADLVIVTVNGLANPHFMQTIRDVTAAARQPVVVIAVRSPYDLRAPLFQDMPTLLTTYEETPWMMRAAAHVLVHGGADARIPVSISSHFKPGSGLPV
ncbi:MAG: hypothetical protein ACYCYO_17835, partial [Bacilli bacterium]